MGFKRSLVWQKGFYVGLLFGVVGLAVFAGSLLVTGILRADSLWDALPGTFIAVLVGGLMGFKWGYDNGYSNSTREYCEAIKENW